VDLEGKRVLVTGGTGSLGGVVVRKLLAGELGRPAKIVVFSRDEAKQHEMRLEYHRRREATDEIIYSNFRDLLTFRLGDMRDYASVVAAVRNVDVVIHAAALKQVPNCEYHVFEAVLTNVFGANNLVRAIRDNHTDVQAVVAISTDKACEPINAMGMTKGLMERVMITANRECAGTRFVCVRYGNVISSRGSVVPLFLDQIKHGGPVTVTTRKMTRFLITLDQAAEAAFAALQHARPGETFVPKLPSALIHNVAQTLIGNRDIPIIVTGIRPGEKVHEVMIHEEERYRTSEREGYYVICPVFPELDTEPIYEPVLTGEYTSEHVTVGATELRELLAPYVVGQTHEPPAA
jgi:FlaA1/EpsC-like NDP-sugar epimerase